MRYNIPPVSKTNLSENLSANQVFKYSQRSFNSGPIPFFSIFRDVFLKKIILKISFYFLISCLLKIFKL